MMLPWHGFRKRKVGVPVKGAYAVQPTRPIVASLIVVAALSACSGHRGAVVAAPVASDVVAPDAMPAIRGLRAPSDGLLTSGQPDAGAWEALAGQGVTTVVNLRPDAEMAGRDERSEVEAVGMDYHQIPMAGGDDINQENAARLRQIIAGAGGRVLVHCASGNRAGALLALDAAASGAISPHDALEYGKSAGITSAGIEAVVRERLGLPAATD